MRWHAGRAACGKGLRVRAAPLRPHPSQDLAHPTQLDAQEASGLEGRRLWTPRGLEARLSWIDDMGNARGGEAPGRKMETGLEWRPGWREPTYCGEHLGSGGRGAEERKGGVGS